MIIFGTGHRPGDAGMEFEHMIELVEDEIVNPNREEVSMIISGMASGFDLAIGLAAIHLDIPLWCAKPWAGHKPRVADKKIYKKLEDYAYRITNVNSDWAYPGPWVYQNRNEWMVDNAQEGIALWNGKRSGGTYNCLKYAKRVNRTVTNVYPNVGGI